MEGHQNLTITPRGDWSRGKGLGRGADRLSAAIVGEQPEGDPSRSNHADHTSSPPVLGR